MQLEKKYSIQDNFIGTFDNFFPLELIEEYINHFNECEKRDLTFGREDETLRKDTMVKLQGFTDGYRYVPHNNSNFIEIFYKQIFPLYIKKFSHFSIEGTPNTIYVLKIQKTKPSEGYHLWHSEAGSLPNIRRIYAFNLYLNDVLEGGETEFLYQKVRVKPIKNRFVLWPAAITHIHRGNPPLSNDKYIITGWVEYA